MLCHWPSNFVDDQLFTMNGIFTLFLWNFHTTCGWEISLRHNNFHNFWLLDSKVIVWYIVFFIGWAILVDEEKLLFSQTKFWNLFSRFIFTWKFWIIPFRSMSQKLWGVLVCGQLWIPYSKINLEVLYLIQFSMFFEKNKILGFRLFIMTLQPLGLEFFNSITKFLTI